MSLRVNTQILNLLFLLLHHTLTQQQQILASAHKGPAQEKMGYTAVCWFHDTNVIKVKYAYFSFLPKIGRPYISGKDKVDKKE